MDSPSVAPHTALPLWQGLRLRLFLRMIKNGMAVADPFTNAVDCTLPANRRPTLKKSYPPLPSRQARVFIPETWKSGDPPLPLIIDIHGGGFSIGAPWVDDKDNLILSNTHGFCVVSIPYRLGPEYKFPTAPKDCAAMISAVMADASLPVDRNRVVVAGYSAGGTMALTATQILKTEDKERIKAVVAYYPVTDSSLLPKEKVSRHAKLRRGRKHFLQSMASMFDQAYIEIGQDKMDPLLSPIYADRNNLPRKIFLIGCEYDILYDEAEAMAENLAKYEGGQRMPLGNGRIGWTKGAIRWEVMPTMEHGFNQIPNFSPAITKMTKRMHQGVSEWLRKEVFI